MMQTPLFYIIQDCGDGSATIRWFKTYEARDLYLELMEEQRGEYPMNDGDGAFTQLDVDNAYETLDQVYAAFK